MNFYDIYSKYDSNFEHPTRKSRQQIADIMSEYESAILSDQSQRKHVEAIGIARSTLRYWCDRKSYIDADPVLTEFFESPVGTAFLHRLALGAHFTMTQSGSCSVRHVCQFFELTGLDRFIASSYGAQQKISVKLEEAVADFGKEETKRLAEGMKPKDITICEDETFHPETCLVAIEPDSNYILLEKYTEGRKASDWTQSIESAMEGLSVNIIQSTSDEGKGIIHHVKKDLGAHHSPDMFHVQHEIAKGTSAPLSRKIKAAQATLEKTSEQVNRCIDEKVDYENGKPIRGRPPQFDTRIGKALLKEEEALDNLATAQSNQIRMRDSIHMISDAYHPVDIETGKLRDAKQVSNSLDQCFSEIEAVASDAKLSESSIKRIKKAKKVVVDMIATIVFFYMTIQMKIEALSLTPEVEWAVFHNLIPAIYLRQTSNKAKVAEIRHRLRKKSEEMLSSLRSENGPFAALDRDELKAIEAVAMECCCLFQRSSSCVEGRNGQLSLRHHSLHRLSDRKLGALTVVHNFFIKRRDGTTAAERFFGKRPRDLFEFLLDKVDLPGRPAKKRFRSKQEMPLLLAA